MDTTLILSPRLSEKAYGLSQVRNTFVFNVPKDANRHAVARAVSAQYDVTVTGVNIAVIKGKAKRTLSKRSRAAGRQSDVKKAYVTLKDGDTLPHFAAVEASEAKAEKVEAATAKAMEKQAKKDEAKPKRSRLTHRVKKEDAS